MKTARRWGRLTARVASLAAGLAVLVLIGAQFAHAVSLNLDLAHRVAAAHAERAQLVADSARLRERIRLLQTPQGVVPAIHDELRLVRPHEEIIYLQGDSADKQ
ncbi:hypothetical protein EPN52_12755 [bacterium]|nr:MAG: hypothetical protein EPN52_12755 [bacterium]